MIRKLRPDLYYPVPNRSSALLRDRLVAASKGPMRRRILIRLRARRLVSKIGGHAT